MSAMVEKLIEWFVDQLEGCDAVKMPAPVMRLDPARGE